jgi:predicted RND superfamily exporter protein
MGHTYPMHWALYHLACIISFVILSIIFVICILNYNDPASSTFITMVTCITIASLFGCIYTGIHLKRRKITYKDKILSSSTTKK